MHFKVAAYPISRVLIQALRAKQSAQLTLISTTLDPQLNLGYLGTPSVSLCVEILLVQHILIDSLPSVRWQNLVPPTLIAGEVIKIVLIVEHLPPIMLCPTCWQVVFWLSVCQIYTRSRPFI